MTDRQYIELAKRTLSTEEDKIGHFVVGITSEAVELLDAYKKSKWYGRELDTRNMKEEIGDLMWYLLQLCDEIGYTLEQAKVDNIAKLQKRYPDGFKDVLIRDADKELDHINQTYMEFK